MIGTIYPSADAVATSEDAGRAGLLQAGYRVITGPGRDWLGLFQRAQVSGKVPGRAVRVGVIRAQHPAAPAQDVLIQFPGRLVLAQRALREYFPAALQAFGDLAAPDTLELLARAPDPASRRGWPPARSPADDGLAATVVIECRTCPCCCGERPDPG